jgi:hypothetical protein
MGGFDALVFDTVSGWYGGKHLTFVSSAIVRMDPLDDQA